MKSKIVISFLLACFVMVSIGYAGEPISFKGTSKTGDEFVLKGVLNKPPSQGPFPAMVLLPGGSGFNRAGYDRWVDKFVNWGYVTLKVETLVSRGLSNIYDGGISKEETAQDAFAAKAYLSGLAIVDRNRIGLFGWGFGGGAVLRVVDPSVRLQNRDIPFKAAVAFYPMCDRPLMGFDTPLLVLNGAMDTMHPAIRCRVIEGRSKHEIIMKTYADGYMFFDMEGTDEMMMGHRFLYNPVAAADAFEQVKNFLLKYAE